MAAGSPRDKWPLGRGFDRFYGFMGGETDQYHPELVCDNQPIEPPRTPEEGYHLTEDLVDHAIRTSPICGACRRRRRSSCGSPRAPATPRTRRRRTTSSATAAQFDQGWDAGGEQVFARQLASGLLPEGTQLSERPSWVPAWDSLSADERRLAARMMEVYAGFLTHTDAQVARILDFIDDLGETDNTIVIVMSDNGASAEGGAKGSFNEQYFFNFNPESLEENLRPDRRARHPEGLQPLPVGLGLGREHAPEALEARDPRGRGGRPADRPLAGPARSPRAAPATSTCTPSTSCRPCSSS